MCETKFSEMFLLCHDLRLGFRVVFPSCKLSKHQSFESRKYHLRVGASCGSAWDGWRDVNVMVTVVFTGEFGSRNDWEVWFV